MRNAYDRCVYIVRVIQINNNNVLHYVGEVDVQLSENRVSQDAKRFLPELISLTHSFNKREPVQV